MAKENTEETRLEAKKSRYSAVSIIMREMYGTKFGFICRGISYCRMYSTSISKKKRCL